MLRFSDNILVVIRCDIEVMFDVYVTLNNLTCFSVTHCRHTYRRILSIYLEIKIYLEKTMFFRPLSRKQSQEIPLVIFTSETIEF